MFVSHKLARIAVTIFVLAAASIAATGCGDSNPSTQQSNDLIPGSADGSVTSEPPPIQLIGGAKSGVRVSEPTAIVIHDSAALKKLAAQNARGGDKSPLSATDFETRQIVGAFVPKQKAGSQLVISSVQEDTKRDLVIVKAVLLGPGKGCKVGRAGRYPYQIVDTRKMDGKPVLELERGSQSAC